MGHFCHDSAPEQFKNKISEAVECGPGKALTNMFKRFEFEIKCLKLDNLQ